MFNTCTACGQYRADKIIELHAPIEGMNSAVCPVCGHRHPFYQLPLLLVGGPSGAGKSAVANGLIGRLDRVVALETDILWRPEFDQPETQYRDFFETWLRMAKNIGQSARPVVLFGAGFAVPGNIEPCIERRYFSAVHYLALVCDDAVLAERLRQRPSWRGSGDEATIATQQAYNQWLMAYNEPTPTMTRLDTTAITLAQTAAAVAGWIDAHASV